MQARFVVSGVVQGVFFRAHTRKHACALDLTGHAINLADGRVEVLACGAATDIAALKHWLHQGSPKAAVSDVQQFESELATVPDQFTTG